MHRLPRLHHPRLRGGWGRCISLVAVAFAASVVAAPRPPKVVCVPDPVEPVWHENGPSATRVKSPAPGMRFTAGVPLRLLADARDPNAWQCPPGHPPYVCNGSMVRFYVDGAPVGSVKPSETDFNLWELRLPAGLAPGDHLITVDFIPYDPRTGGGGAPVAGAVAVKIHVDPMPTNKTTLVLDKDVVLTGTTALNWTDKLVIGNGFKVSSVPGYSGKVVIQRAHVIGLGSFTAPGMQVTTSGAIKLRDSVFEASGSLRLGSTGQAAITVRGNELRANNLLTYVSSDPEVPIALQLEGATTGAKVVQGNRIGGGMLALHGGGRWQVGGTLAGQSNVLMGPRAVLQLAETRRTRIQGNYMNHDYHGGFSQGYNLWVQGGADHLAEHNIIVDGSWPVQSFGGEFRYNLLVNSGHDFWRSAAGGTRIHHNVFVHATGTNTGYDGAIRLTGSETALELFNNTFDVGGSTGQFDAPVLAVGSKASFKSVRNNLFTAFSDVSDSFGRAFVTTLDGRPPASPRVDAADYNAWHNPLATRTAAYLAGMAAGTPGEHDVRGDPRLSLPPEIPYSVPRSCIWQGSMTIGEALRRYREMYRPAPGSPLIGAGDPSDGVGTPIGAIGADDLLDIDLFGRVLP